MDLPVLEKQPDGSQLLFFEGREVALPTTVVWVLVKDPQSGEFLIDVADPSQRSLAKPKWVKHLMQSKKAR